MSDLEDKIRRAVIDLEQGPPSRRRDNGDNQISERLGLQQNGAAGAEWGAPSIAAAGHRLRPAAVLVPLVRRDDGHSVMLTQRTAHLTSHAGQISFPGGGAEKEDRTPIDTALRETEEETGLGRQHVDVVGYLDTYETGTGYLITPVVGFIAPPFDLKHDPFEVAEIFEVPLAFFLDRDNHQRHKREWKGVLRHYYAMPYGDYYVWGATAGMLVNLYRRINDLSA